MRRSLCALIAILCIAASAPPQNPPVPPAPPSPPTNQPIPRETLEAMYRRELGKAWNAQIAPKLFEAHILLEKYFSAKSAVEPGPIETQLEATALDSNLVGRLAR